MVGSMSAPGRQPRAMVPPPPRRRPGLLLFVPTALLALVGCAPSAPEVVLDDLPSVSTARQLLADLPAHGERYYVAPYPYARSYFGATWDDVDGNGRGTRDDVLAAQLASVVYTLDGNVASGEFVDPYTGMLVQYVRGRTEADPVVVDHVVSLWEAWATGAWAWTPEERLVFANDPINLVATTYAINELKGPQNPARWHPATWQQECEFALRVVATKAKYRLQIHDADREYLGSVLAACS